jgi:uncharacterized protein YigA (DUF484 family)
MAINLSKVNEKLKVPGKRSHQNLSLVPKAMGELRRATHKLEAKARDLTRKLEEVKRKKKASRG